MSHWAGLAGINVRAVDRALIINQILTIMSEASIIIGGNLMYFPEFDNEEFNMDMWATAYPQN